MANTKVTLSFGLLLAFLGSVAPTLTTVNLGNASTYVILAQSSITTTGTTAVLGNVGISPAASTAITGFGLILFSDGTYSTSARVTGKVYAANYATPTPANLGYAINDMVTAYNDAAGRLNPDYLALGGGALNGNILTAGLYKWTTGVTVGGTVTISGSPTDIFIFQIAGNFVFNSGAQIILAGGALPKNIFWQVAGQVTLGSTSTAQGIILGKTAIVFNSGASLSKGRALAQTAVTLISNAINKP